MMAGEAPLLDIQHLRIETAVGPIVEDVCLTVSRGEMVGLVGESGCGKTLTALSILGLLPEQSVRIGGGRILFKGDDLAGCDERRMTALRGSRIAMIFQEPMTSLNPVMTVGSQIAEVLAIHRGQRGRAAEARVAELLAMVGLSAGAQMHRYPFQLSGGQRQRVMIAMALACGPDLLIADEPTTALDVTVQAQILELIARMQAELGMGCILVTHDLGVVAEMCGRIAVMYAGRIVETGPAEALFGAPMHRYTRALIDTIPASNEPGRTLPAIPGMVPPPGARARGCSFFDRCSAVTARCRDEAPPLVRRGDHVASCWNPAS
ncbi:oligopeptide/dipeptide ABC transporter ATP-binding protein [Chelatococcus caeni]|uniref:Oligopeptide/dipeptide ABC transporter ATP-binding protein n=1 Tax=Chelatococcus caeni TaxID=1348468 RepID=A0A840BYV7_9HYPH|nr:ABC transporter ATP-binding protein [Chelatococcus caeni]MBB4018324.1 oligopeptide/dipeptide ABC transporter ATP-binding protein [Chelatococcus caeni]